MRKKIMIFILIFISTTVLGYFALYPTNLMKSIDNENESAIKFHLKLHGGINRLNYPKIGVFENYTYHTPFSYACSVGASPQILELLIESGAKMEGDDWHFSGMYYLLTINNQNNLENIELLLDNGFNPNYIEYYQQRLLELSISPMRGEIEYDLLLHFNIYELLVERGATQISSDIFEIIEVSNGLILESHIENKNLDLDVQNSDGQTALMIVSGANSELINEEMVRPLINAGADKTIIDSNGKTALDYALNSGNQIIVDILTE
ncbi:MAG: ankyrin repeat domain-containing protein [Candidatus Izemoplasmatales bacterium]|nr:ankyrin repeat domain-containing protein [Candidatus Izemoplasmatales bacterium]MDD4069448.1 ankyrin repeat domain-containing protein [Candidatus Izemoplasmatales bacterium]